MLIFFARKALVIKRALLLNLLTNSQKITSIKPKLKDNKDSSAVFVNDILSKETLNFLNYARALKNVGYSFVFARGGRIFLRRVKHPERK